MPPRHTTSHRRPSDRELSNKVRDALAAIIAGRRQIALTKHLVADLEELKLAGEAELWHLMPHLLGELIQSNPISCYAGRHPPTPSYEPEILNQELWAYRWPSVKLGRELYLKFVIVKNRAGEPHYLHVDLHPDRPEKRGKP